MAKRTEMIDPTFEQRDQLRSLLGMEVGIDHKSGDEIETSKLEQYQATLTSQRNGNSHWSEGIADAWLASQGFVEYRGEWVEKPKAKDYSARTIARMVKHRWKRIQWGKLKGKMGNIKSEVTNTDLIDGFKHTDEGLELRELLGKTGLEIAMELGADLTEAIIRCRTIKQAAAMTGICTRTVHRRVNLARIKVAMMSGAKVA